MIRGESESLALDDRELAEDMRESVGIGRRGAGLDVLICGRGGLLGIRRGSALFDLDWEVREAAVDGATTGTGGGATGATRVKGADEQAEDRRRLPGLPDGHKSAGIGARGQGVMNPRNGRDGQGLCRRDDMGDELPCASRSSSLIVRFAISSVNREMSTSDAVMWI